jgi:hypothetical protein
VFVGGQALSATTGSFSGNVTLGSSVLATPTGSAPSYLCRAWVNFNGTGTPAIRASGNVSSLTDNGVGDYNINYTTSMPDGKYSVAGSSTSSGGGVYIVSTDHVGDYPTTNVRIGVTNGSGTYADRTIVNVAIFR